MVGSFSIAYFVSLSVSSLSNQTTDGTHQKLLKMNNIVMATGLEKDSTEENVKSQVPEAQREFISKVKILRYSIPNY